MKNNRIEFPIGAIAITTVCIFFIIYNISFIFAPSFSTARVFVLLLALYFFFRGLKQPFKIGYYPFLILVFLLPVLVQNYFSGDSTQTSRLFHLFFYSFFGSSLLAALAGNLKVILFSYTIAVTIQSIIIIIVFSNMQLRELIGPLIVINSNYEYDTTYRSIGFSSTGAADLSVKQSIGVISGIWLLSITKNTRNILQTIFLFLLITLCGVSTIFVGRTGLIVSIIFIVEYLFISVSLLRIKDLIYICLGLSFVYELIEIFSNYIDSIENFSTDYFYEWAFGIFKTGSNGSVEDLADMPIPPITIETTLGTGLVSDISGYGNASGHDAGYIQNYYSMGLILSIIFYFFLAYILAYYIKGRGIIAWSFFIVLFVLEIKEPFIFKYNAVMFLMLTYYAERTQITNKFNNNSVTQHFR